MHIINKITGQEIYFVATGTGIKGQSLDMLATYPAFSPEPPAHYHPHQEEFFGIIEGELTVRLNGEINVYREGDMVHIKKGVPHSVWNAGFGVTRVNWKVFPAMDTAHFLTTLTQLANEGKTNTKGIPSLPVMLFLLKKHHHTFRLVKPPAFVLWLMAIILQPVFYLCGYKKRFSQQLLVPVKIFPVSS